MMDEITIHDYQKQQDYGRKEADLLKLKYNCDPEEMAYWSSLEPSPEFQPIPESDEPFSTDLERHESEPQTLSEFIHFSKYGYFLRRKEDEHGNNF